MIKGPKRLSYEQRIKLFGLDFLEWRGKRGDLISTFKLIKDLDSAKLINNFDQNCPARYYFLMNRVAPIWNSLPYYVVNAKTISKFKNKPDEWNFKRQLH